jgi:DNA (cytosine-5)-methyltransferase 1
MPNTPPSQSSPQPDGMIHLPDDAPCGLDCAGARPLTFISLFAGIGGFDLGLERAGMKCIAQVEIDPYCRDVLAKHWPNVLRFEDVRKFCRRIYDCDPENEEGEVNCPRCGVEFGACGCIGTDQFTDEHGFPDIIAAGFECQDISIANWTGAKGIKGERSGLWSEVLRISGELRPRWLLLENSPEIVSRGLGTVLGGLAEIGYDAEWTCVRAARFGAPHNRERWYAIAYPTEVGQQAFLDDAIRQHVETESFDWEFAGVVIQTRGFWATQSAPAAVDDGLSAGVVGPALSAIGNAVVPQVAEVIGRAIINTHRRTP